METTHLVSLGLTELLLAYGLILLAAGLVRLERIGQEWQMIRASLRMVVQLIAVGYLLHVVFAVRNPGLVLLMLLVMALFSLQVLGSRVQHRMPRFYRIVGSSLLAGCGGVTFVFCALVVGYTPWYDPRYLIPLAGMIVGNSMNGASLAAERLSSELHERRDEIETALCLGASSRQAAENAVRSAFRAALMPTVNTMAATGIVSLPGMMTGQILSGTAPILAVRYQIAIMCAITAAVAVTSFMILLQGHRQYFTSAHQLKERELL
ncbi:ABC transporter permease [Trichlorobacter ammonificans]|uniref:Iron export ABC transporter permease subunit FetB n=1 Tax=Trichlorobacter ammonificans TaxID=2916410 RepID=A0ABM9D9D3_9BACT|nr:iron export ABC transporter permease subunit FetB [Trichlorobacter ammonificans]CAH2031817.1 Iron export ABC transporter permease subunit FetB [Trichlorobacter ammonificans]